MELTKKAIVLGVLQKEVENHRNNYSNWESQEKLFILSLMAENLDGTNGTPEDSCSEEGVWTRAEESHRRIRLADIFDIDLAAQNS